MISYLRKNGLVGSRIMRIVFFFSMTSLLLANGATAEEKKVINLNDYQHKPAEQIFSAKLLFLDGTPVRGNIELTASLQEYPPGFSKNVVIDGKKYGMKTAPAPQIVKTKAVNKVGGRNYVPSESGTDKKGMFYFSFDYPGRYALHFGEILLDEFEVKLLEDGALDVGLPEAIHLPFNFILETAPGQVVEFYNMGQEMKLTETAGDDGLILFAGPSDVPGPGVKFLQRFNHRKIKVFPALIQKKGLLNINSQTQFWLEKTGYKKDEDQMFWVFRYHRGSKTLSLSPFVFPEGLLEKFEEFNREVFLPKPYLDEDGEVRVGFNINSRDNTEQIFKYYALDTSMRWSQVEQAYSGAFNYQGMAIRGTKWMIPNIGGIPASADGSNTLSFECTIKWDLSEGERKKCIENFKSLYLSRHKDVKREDVYWTATNPIDDCRNDPECSCPPRKIKEKIVTGAHSFELPRFPSGWFNMKELPAIDSSKYIEEVGSSCKAFLNGQGPLRIRAVSDPDYHEDDTVGGGPCTHYIYDGDDEMLKLCQESQRKMAVRQEEPEEQAEPDKIVLNDIRFWSESIDLFADFENKSATLLNTREGPYSTLRYKQGESVINVCPQNYSWHVSPSEGIKTDHSSILCGEGAESASADLSLSLKVSADGYRDSEPLYKDIRKRPGQFVVTGSIRDRTGKLLPGATIEIPELNTQVKSDEKGRYRIGPPNLRSVDWSADFILEKVFKNIVGTIESVSGQEVYANGRKGRLRLQVMADGKPYANRQVHIIQTGNFKAYGEPTKLVQLVGSTFSGKLNTDANGWVEFAAPGPRVNPGAISAWSDPAPLFPIQGEFELRGEWDSTKHVMATYDVHNPFPRISKTSMTHNVEEETWQIRPSRVWIDDPDSENQGGWQVTVSGPGRFKVRYGKVRYKELYEPAPSSPFEFHYRPPKMGYNLQEQPDLWGELLKTNMNALKGVYLSILENDVLKNTDFTDQLYKDMKLNNDITLVGKDNWMSKSYNKVSGYLDTESGSKVFNSLAGGDKRRGDQILNLMKNGITALDRATDTINMQEMQSSSDGVTSQEVFATIDYALNMADSIAGVLGLVSHNTYTEVAKLLWENSKTIYAIHAKHEEINNTILDEKRIPLTITVEDELGHATKKIVMVDALIWVTNN